MTISLLHIRNETCKQKFIALRAGRITRVHCLPLGSTIHAFELGEVFFFGARHRHEWIVCAPVLVHPPDGLDIWTGCWALRDWLRCLLFHLASCCLFGRLVTWVKDPALGLQVVAQEVAEDVPVAVLGLARCGKPVL